jgi:hypothetical protein
VRRPPHLFHDVDGFPLGRVTGIPTDLFL